MSYDPIEANATHDCRLEIGGGRVVVCVPTYRRPEKLRHLLAELKRQSPGFAFGILVGNNEVGHPLPFSPADDDLPSFTVLDVAEPGVSEVRNALIAFALQAFGNLQWIIFIDDDQLPAPDWLRNLVTAADQYAPDFAGGPVLKTPESPTPWSALVTNRSYLPASTGVVPMLHEAGNLAISAHFLRALARKPFDPNFGRSGGEDYELFCFAVSQRALMIWVQNAVAHEAIPAVRCSLRGLLSRDFASCAAQARADRRYHTRGQLFIRSAKRAARIPAYTWRSLRAGHGLTITLGTTLSTCAGVAGWISGLIGIKLRRYGLQ